MPFEAGHPHQVGIGAERDVRPPREFDGVVHAPHRQHADRTAGTVDHPHIGRQQVLQPVAGDGVGVAAAELHEAIVSVGLRLGANFLRDFLRQLAVAIFIDIFHALNP